MPQREGKRLDTAPQKPDSGRVVREPTREWDPPRPDELGERGDTWREQP